MSIQLSPLARIGYVNLGLFAHAVLECLYEIEGDKGELSSRPQPMLEAAVISLRRIRGGQQVEETKLPGLTSYEEISSLLSVLERHSDIGGLRGLQGLLDTIRQDRTDDAERLSKTREAIDVFIELSSAAVLGARAGEDTIPSGVRELVSKRASA